MNHPTNLKKPLPKPLAEVQADLPRPLPLPQSLSTSHCDDDMPHDVPSSLPDQKEKEQVVVEIQPTEKAPPHREVVVEIEPVPSKYATDEALWAAVIRVGRTYGGTIPAWSGIESQSSGSSPVQSTVTETAASDLISASQSTGKRKRGLRETQTSEVSYGIHRVIEPRWISERVARAGSAREQAAVSEKDSIQQTIPTASSSRANTSSMQ
eukprot:GHVU01014983.1.p1 GENE.GHVU01014983.1~~GHVU01014983.1.p1  ORF type:complete len:210 (+),score=11.48 GHVU01014983.1:49-678(+)